MMETAGILTDTEDLRQERLEIDFSPPTPHRMLFSLTHGRHKQQLLFVFLEKAPSLFGRKERRTPPGKRESALVPISEDDFPLGKGACARPALATT